MSIAQLLTYKHIAQKGEELKNVPSEQLREQVIEYNEQHGKDSFPGFDQMMFASKNSEPIKVAAAVDILKKRHGSDYVFEMFGLRKPKTFREMLYTIFTGQYISTN